MMKEKGEPIMVCEGRLVVHSFLVMEIYLIVRGKSNVAESMNCMLSCEGFVCVLAARAFYGYRVLLYKSHLGGSSAG